MNKGHELHALLMLRLDLAVCGWDKMELDGQLGTCPGPMAGVDIRCKGRLCARAHSLMVIQAGKVYMALCWPNQVELIKGTRGFAGGCHALGCLPSTCVHLQKAAAHKVCQQTSLFGVMWVC